MSIDGYTDRLLKRMDRAFEDAANALFNATKQFDDKRAILMAGKMDAITSAVATIKEVKKLYITEDSAEEESNESPALY